MEEGAPLRGQKIQHTLTHGYVSTRYTMRTRSEWCTEALNIHKTASSGIYRTPPGGCMTSQRQLALVAGCGRSSARRSHSRTVEGVDIWGLLLAPVIPRRLWRARSRGHTTECGGIPESGGLQCTDCRHVCALPKGILAVFDSPRSLPLLTSPCGPASHGGGVRFARRLAYHSPWWGFRLLLGKPVEMSRPRTRLP